MMKYFSIFFFILLLWSCGSDNDAGPVEEAKIEIISSGTEQALADEGGSAIIRFTANAPWKATADQEWCTVSPASGKAGTVEVSVTASANAGYDERNAKVVIESGTAKQSVTITQKQKDAIVLTSSKVEVVGDGGEFSIEVQANIPYEYEIEESAKAWITPRTTTRGLTTSVLRFVAAENTNTEKRQGSVTIRSGEKAETVTVYQEGMVPSIVLTKNEYVVSDKGETIQVELKSNVAYEVQMPGVDWITETKTRAMSSFTHYFVVAANEGYDSREATVVFKNTENGLSESVKIAQVQKDAIVVAQKEYSVPREGGAIEVEVGANVEFKVQTSVDWISQTRTRGLVTEKLKFQVGANDGEESREGSITIESGELKQSIKVTQAGKVSDEADRKILEAFYHATGGDNWIINTNWCSDKPLGEWAFVHTNKDGRVTGLGFRKNNMVGAADLSGLEYLDSANIEETGLTSLNVSGCIRLSSLNCYNNSNLTSIDVSGCSGLRQLEVDENKLTAIDFTGCTSLTYLRIDGNKLPLSCVQPLAGQLTYFSCCDCGLSSLEIAMPKLSELHCGGNSLTSLDLSRYPRLAYLTCSDNQLSSLDFSVCPRFEELDCSRNQITTLNFSGCNNLWGVSCDDNRLSSLDLSAFKELHSFHCINNLFTTLDVTSYEALESFSCGGEGLMTVYLPSRFKDSYVGVSGWGEHDPKLYEEPSHKGGYQYPVLIYK